VYDFYRLVSQQRFDQAAQLWTPQMRATNPPATEINGRFSGASLTVLAAQVTSQSNGQAVVSVDLLESGGTQPGEIAGTWSVAYTSSGWLLSRPNLHPVSNGQAGNQQPSGQEHPGKVHGHGPDHKG